MKWEINLFSPPLLVTAIISGILAVYAWRRRAIPGGTAFFVLMAAVAEWSLCYALELGSSSLALKMFWVRLEYFGIVTIPAAWLVFSLQYTGMRQSIVLRKLASLALMPALTLILAWTNPYHGLIWREILFDSGGLVPTLTLHYGPAFWVHTVYSYLLVSAGMVVLFRFFLRAQQLYRRQVKIVMLAFFIAWLLNVIYILKLTPIPNLDLTPFAFAVTVVLAALGFLRLQFLDLVPMARGAILESMRDAVLVLDAWNRIADYNPAAEELTHRKLSDHLGKPAEEVFSDHPEWIRRFSDARKAEEVLVGGDPDNPKYIHLQISPLYDRIGRFTGRLIVLQDISEEELAKLALQISNIELEDRVKERTSELRARIEMERLVSSISTRFIHLRIHEIDQEIDRSLQMIGEFAGVNRSYLFRVSADGRSVTNTHEWTAPGTTSYRDLLADIPCDQLPWWMERLRDNEIIYLPRDATLPQQARREKEILRSKDSHSLVVVPLMYGKILTGFLGFDSCQKSKAWAEEDRVLLRIVGETFINAFARVEAEKTILASEAELRAVFAAMQDQVLVCDRSGRILKIARTQLASQHLAIDFPDGKTLHEILPRETADLILKYIREALDRQKTTQVDYALSIKGQKTWFSGAISPIEDDRIVLVARDITERKASEELMVYKALHDSLTGLPNRRLFLDRLERSFERIKRYPQWNSAVLYMDLDGFKAINDSLGHAAGDRFLTGIARRLRKSMRASDTVARLGGDEFAVLLEDLQGLEEAIHIADRLQEELSAPIELDGQHLSAQASIGIALVSSGYQDPEEILRDADTAMYQAKSNGKGRYEIFYPPGQGREVNDAQIRADLQRAFEHGEFQLYYQPVVDLKSGETTSVEALLRWRHPKRGLLLPGEFLDAAERSQLMIDIGEWVLRTACTQVKAWHEAGYRDLRVAVNTSTHQFHGTRLMELVPEVLAEAELDPRYLELEVSEQTALQEPGTTASTLAGLIQLGVNVAIDDFGKGGSPVHEMERIPGGSLKLDPGFILETSSDPERAALAGATITRAHQLDRKIVAKRVETGEQLAWAVDQGCDQVQGFLISQAIPATCVADFLRHASSNDGSLNHGVAPSEA